MPIKVEKSEAGAAATQDGSAADAGAQGKQAAQSASGGAGPDVGTQSGGNSQPFSKSAGECAGASAAKAPAPAAPAPAAAAAVQGARERAPEPARLRMHDAVQQLSRDTSKTGDYASQAALENVAVALAHARYVIANNVPHAKGAAREMLETLKRVI